MTALKIKIYGDSIMRGVMYDAATGRYSQREGTGFGRLSEQGLDISCVARMGATSEKGLELISRDIAAEPDACYDLTLLEFGANDADFDWDAVSAAPASQHLPKVSEADFIANMRRMTALVRPRSGRVALSTLMPFETNKYFDWLSHRLIPENILLWLGGKQNLQRSYARYNELVRQLAADEGLALFDLRAVFEAAGDLTCDDGVHPGQAGYDLLDEKLVSFVRTLLTIS